MATDVEERFQGPLVLDGGMATELERGGADLRDALWSARLLKDEQPYNWQPASQPVP